MAGEVSLEEQASQLPERPGVYMFRGPGGEVLYVGKALSLRSRVRSYLQPPERLAPRTRALMEQARALDYMVTDSELEALILELTLIKRHRPRYNVRFVDDKQFPYLRVNLREPFPRVQVVRQARSDGARYFGPYARAGAMREALQLARELFPLRTCSDRRLAQGGRPCLYYHIRRCLGPCVGAVAPEEYRQVAEALCLFFEGRLKEAVRAVEAEMQRAAQSLNFERAAALRDRMVALEEATRRQKVVSTNPVDQDVVGLARVVRLTPRLGVPPSAPDACGLVMCVRDGKLVGQEHLLLQDTVDYSDAELLGAFLQRYYARATFIPREILLPTPPEDEVLITAWLGSLRGGAVELVQPRRGPRRRLLELADDNAAYVLGEAGRPRREAAAVADLQSALGLEHRPERIEGYDISNLQGQETVGSMVVFEGGRPAPDQYRRFKVRRQGGPDDYASLGEVLKRRLKRGLAERAAGGGGKFSALPDLVLVDGGKGQLGVAVEALTEVGLEGLPVCALAKGEEELHLPGHDQPLALPAGSRALQLAQRVRDEAHRFAVTYHRHSRRQASLRSALDDVAGIGPRRKRELLRRFASLDDLAKAGVEELAAVPGMNREVAGRLKEHLAGRGGG